MKDKWKRRS